MALARGAGDAALEDAALDLLTALHLKLDDLPAAVATVHRRQGVIDMLPMVAVNGLEFSDHHLYAAEVLLAAGDLRGAAEHADRLAALPFNRADESLGLARRLKVEALAGDFDAVLRDADRFLAGWERAGRPVVPDLASCAYTVAMVHGIRGDEAGRAAWTRVTETLSGSIPSRRRQWSGGRTFDALVALHHGDVDAQ